MEGKKTVEEGTACSSRGYMPGPASTRDRANSLMIAGQSLIKFGKLIRWASAGATINDKFIIE